MFQALHHLFCLLVDFIFCQNLGHRHCMHCLNEPHCLIEEGHHFSSKNLTTAHHLIPTHRALPSQSPRRGDILPGYSRGNLPEERTSPRPWGNGDPAFLLLLGIGANSRGRRQQLWSDLPVQSWDCKNISPPEMGTETLAF